MSLVLEHKRQKQVDVNFVNLLLLILLRSYQTGYWRADKARMSSVSPEESPVFNCSSLLTTSRDQDSECVRLGPAGWWGWEFRTWRWRGKGPWEGVGVHGHYVYTRVEGVDINRWTLFGLKGHWVPVHILIPPLIHKDFYTVQVNVLRTTVLALTI